MQPWPTGPDHLIGPGRTDLRARPSGDRAESGKGARERGSEGAKEASEAAAGVPQTTGAHGRHVKTRGGKLVSRTNGVKDPGPGTQSGLKPVKGFLALERPT